MNHNVIIDIDSVDSISTRLDLTGNDYSESSVINGLFCFVHSSFNDINGPVTIRVRQRSV